MYLRKTLNFAKAISLASLYNKKTPINVMWRITNRCNSQCSYCGIWKRKQKELTTEEIISLIDQMAQCGTQRIGFVGGEAFLREDFEQIVDHVKCKGIYVTLVSNGILVPKNMHIVKKLDYLALSFDGRKTNHERGRSKGSFDGVMKAFNACKKNNIKVLTITVLNKYNLGDIDYVLSVAQQYCLMCNFHVLLGGEDCYPTDDQYRKAFDYLIKKKKEGAPILLSSKAMRFLREWPDYKKFVTKREIKGYKCWAGKLIFNVDSDGTIAGCDILTHIVKNNPSCIKLGFEKAYKSVKTYGCEACTCAPFIEYNYMFSLRPSVILDWGKIIFGRR